MNKRSAERAPLMVDLIYEVDGVAIARRATDISEGGIFVDTAVPAEPGTQLRVKFQLNEHQIETRGRVAYSQPFIGMGIEFVSLPDEARCWIRQYVERQLVGTR